MVSKHADVCLHACVYVCMYVWSRMQMYAYTIKMLVCAHTYIHLPSFLPSFLPSYLPFFSLGRFEIPKFVSTLILCGVATLVPAEGASQVFIALVTSTAMLVLYANYQPYVSKNDDILAQVCQFSLTFTISVGLLHMASEAFQVIACPRNFVVNK